MPISPNVHLRGFRKRSSLTQGDVARLLGRLCVSPVSRLENGEGTPDLPTALGLELILGASASKLFRTQFLDIAARVRDRAKLLDERLAMQTETLEVRRRRGELRAIITRIDQFGA